MLTLVIKALAGPRLQYYLHNLVVPSIALANIHPITREFIGRIPWPETRHHPPPTQLIDHRQFLG